MLYVPSRFAIDYVSGHFHQSLTFQHLGQSRSCINEPHREKTGLRGFRPGATQIGLYSHRSRLDT